MSSPRWIKCTLDLTIQQDKLGDPEHFVNRIAEQFMDAIGDGDFATLQPIYDADDERIGSLSWEPDLDE